MAVPLPPLNLTDASTLAARNEAYFGSVLAGGIQFPGANRSDATLWLIAAAAVAYLIFRKK